MCSVFTYQFISVVHNLLFAGSVFNSTKIIRFCCVVFPNLFSASSRDLSLSIYDSGLVFGVNCPAGSSDVLHLLILIFLSEF